VDLAEETGVLVRKGAWYSYNGDNISQGRDNAIKCLAEKPGFAQEVETLVREKLAMGAQVSANSVGQADPDLEEEFEEDED
jgi:recombination protein RecA